MRISDWSSDVCSSDLHLAEPACPCRPAARPEPGNGMKQDARPFDGPPGKAVRDAGQAVAIECHELGHALVLPQNPAQELEAWQRVGPGILVEVDAQDGNARRLAARSEEHTAELQSL